MSWFYRAHSCGSYSSLKAIIWVARTRFNTSQIFTHMTLIKGVNSRVRCAEVTKAVKGNGMTAQWVSRCVCSGIFGGFQRTSKPRFSFLTKLSSRKYPSHQLHLNGSLIIGTDNICTLPLCGKLWTFQQRIYKSAHNRLCDQHARDDEADRVGGNALSFCWRRKKKKKKHFEELTLQNVTTRPFRINQWFCVVRCSFVRSKMKAYVVFRRTKTENPCKYVRNETSIATNSAFFRHLKTIVCFSCHFKTIFSEPW